MSQSSKKVFIGLTAIASCPKCKKEFMPCMNMAMCKACSVKKNCCSYCGLKSTKCNCSHVK